MKTILWFPTVVFLALSSFFFSLTSGKEIIITRAPSLSTKPITILAFGDMMLDRAVREKINQYGPAYPFEKIKHLLPGHDIVVANAEGVFTNNVSISAADHSILRFTFEPSVLPTLRALGFTVLSQANNHALDFGEEGLQFSKNAIAQNGLSSFGDPLNKNPGPLYIPVRGETVAFVGYHQLFTYDASTTLAAIAKAHSQGAFVIVYPHWGEEYNLETTPLQVELAHTFIDAGADAVIGAHPHVVEPREIYKGKAIFYSIGNFIFDQRWNEHVSHGIAVEISLTKTEVSYQLIPYKIENEQPYQTGEIESFVLKR